MESDQNYKTKKSNFTNILRCQQSPIKNIITAGSSLLPLGFASPAEGCDAIVLTSWPDLETSCCACGAEILG